MTILKSFWVVISYTIKGEKWYFMNGVMEINMLNALARFVDHPMHYGIEITEHSADNWTAVDTASHRAPEVCFTVWMQNEQPDLKHPNMLIRDHRSEYLLHESKKDKPKLPIVLTFGKPKQLDLI